MSIVVIGIDPGATGGVAFLYGHAMVPLLIPMPTIGKEIDFKRLCEHLRATMPQAPRRVYLERAQAFPKAGVSGMFNYGASYWGVQGICAALEIPYTLVPPATWHRALIVGRDGDPKIRAAMTARQLFPTAQLLVGKSTKPHTGLVDSLLIAEYGRRMLYGAHRQ